MAAVSCVFRRRLRQTHAISADARGKLEKFLISKKKLRRGKKYTVNCGRVNEPLRLIHTRRCSLNFLQWTVSMQN